MMWPDVRVWHEPDLHRCPQSGVNRTWHAKLISVAIDPIETSAAFQHARYDYVLTDVVRGHLHLQIPKQILSIYGIVSSIPPMLYGLFKKIDQSGFGILVDRQQDGLNVVVVITLKPFFSVS
jgi:hypothetical protein